MDHSGLFLIILMLCVSAVALPLRAHAQENTVTSILQSVLNLQQQIMQLLTSPTFFISPTLKRVGIGTKTPVSTLDVNAADDADTTLLVRYAGNLGHRASLILSNKAIGQSEGSAGIWTIVAGNKQTGTLGQRLGISGHNGTPDPNYKFMLDFNGNVELGNDMNPAGITLYDTVTKQPYCIRITNGMLTPSVGNCSQ
ncbi:MAG: hypothetical protein G01um10148_375 [Parcubacteria group bacterium Gr01-1014_8]|nr:MAG: hypothetical protein G01um10148_375 [Parcubacteria group bacterium Gr01-1014_8]